MEAKELTLEQIHKETLTIYEKIVEICDKLNINHFVTYGTLLGAVRHKGYIPWDDDFDIMMFREDYDKFLEYCDNNEIYPYKLINYHNDPQYTFGISRFCDLRYKMILDDGNPTNMGMFIDIYPYDGMGNYLDASMMKKMDRRNKRLALGLYYSNKNNTVPKQGNLIKRIARRVFCLYAQIMGREYFINAFEKAAHKYTIEESELIDCVIWDPTKYMKKEWFLETIELDFEHLKVKAPKHYDEILKGWYGDYMTMPPEDQRAPSHQYKLYKKEN